MATRRRIAIRGIPLKRVFLGTLGAVTLVVGAVLLSPVGPIPGGTLSGETVDEAVVDWSFAGDERFCHLETKVPEPRSIAVTCIVSDGQLYVGCSSCSGRYWSQQLSAEPNVRYGVLGKIYNVEAARVRDQDEIDRVWLARASKYGDQNPDPKPHDFWFFRLVSR